MSKMTKFLKQRCQFEEAQRINGATVLNEYGDIQYTSPKTLMCRREKYVRDIQTYNGAILKANTRYFLDESVEIQADDRLDGHVILSCEEYIDQFGECVGYEAYV